MMMQIIMTATANLTECGATMTKPLVGNCTGSKTPDDWYPEIGPGRITENRLRAFRSRVAYAVDHCNSCPIKKECLEQGMMRDNLPYGIWGGKLAGQRLLAAGFTKDEFQSDTEIGRAFKLIEVLGVS
jgi:hypothetical protein